ncbi:MAG: hypothetical protein Q9182_000953 [Xanthomendoza sp. 2 TL-2023]
MEAMEIDTVVREAPLEVIDSGATLRTGDFNKFNSNEMVVQPEVAKTNGSAVNGNVLAGPRSQSYSVQQHIARQTQALDDAYQAEHEPETRFAAQDSAAGQASASEDELLDGKTAWTMPITQPKLLATGLCYDVRMRYHCELDPPKQRLDFHPEDPRRIYHIYRELCQAGLYKDPQFNVPIIDKPLERIQARSATAAEICLVHTVNHYNFVESTAAMTDENLIHLERMYDSIYFNKLTYSSALLSAGGAIETCKAVVSGRVKNAIAVIRPPGHHAECNRPMGFCLFDNVSVAAKVCNGIQQAFEQDPNVLYISIHVHEDGNFYPPGPYGDHMHCGAGAGLGKNINIPWPTKGMGDADYLYAFQQVVMPVAYDFNPDLVIIAAGFDAAVGDQLGGCFVTPTCYAHMAHMLMPLAKGKLVVCLEGGYNLASISKSALAVTRTLLGEPPDRIELTKPTRFGAATVDMVRVYQCRFWPCLASESKTSTKDALRSYQKQQLCDDFDMMELSVFRERISKSFKNQVLATVNYTDAYDTLSWYREWAINAGFAIIDVNFPNHIADTNDTDELNNDTELENAKRAAERAELAIYLWENYIEPNDATAIFFMGVGSPSREIIHILNNREPPHH